VCFLKEIIMGWSFACSPRHGKKELVQQLRDQTRFSPGYKMLKSQVVGNHFWYLMETPDGRTTIGLDLMAGGGHQGMGWGYKGIHEEMGPCEHDCPLSYLEQASEPVGYAIEWRQEVRAYHAKRKAAKPHAGLVVEYCGNRYMLVSSAGPRKGWRVIGADGATYRMRAKQIANSTAGGQSCQES
jgi:hypothetical protein